VLIHKVFNNRKDLDLRYRHQLERTAREFIGEGGMPSFALQWTKELPGRWARNGAIFGAILVYARRDDSRSLTYIFEDFSRLAFFLGSMVFIAGVFALIAYLLGLWARSSLSPIDEAHLAVSVKTIPRKWVIGTHVLGGLTILLDIIFEWRGQRFALSGTPEAIVENVGHLVGMVTACVAVGLITGYISRRGLNKAIANDRLSIQPIAPRQDSVSA